MVIKKRKVKRTSSPHALKAHSSIRIYDGYAWVYEGYYLFGFIPLYVIRTYERYNERMK